ncbi:hypothetical protein VTL71DRAFT_12048 [Oculimacula yallundae]|uniref:Uncharacterized protein n=1 Tax=Oculimacula yallundae TaxID=86028 RepID=A0ABR4CRW6_9HELO
MEVGCDWTAFPRPGWHLGPAQVKLGQEHTSGVDVIAGSWRLDTRNTLAAAAAARVNETGAPPVLHLHLHLVVSKLSCILDCILVLVEGPSPRADSQYSLQYSASDQKSLRAIMAVSVTLWWHHQRDKSSN